MVCKCTLFFSELDFNRINYFIFDVIFCKYLADSHLIKIFILKNNPYYVK